MNYQTTCNCCGHVTTAYTIAINKGLMDAFARFAAESFKMIQMGMTKKEMEERGVIRSNSQYTNFHNLQYFGIIENNPDNREVWYLTQKGYDFWMGITSIVSPVAVMAGEVLPDDHEAWRTHKGKRRAVSIADVLGPEYKRREEYQMEKSSY